METREVLAMTIVLRPASFWIALLVAILPGCDGSLPATSPDPAETTLALRIAEAPPGFLEATTSIYIRATTGSGGILLDSVFPFQRRTGVPLTIPVDQSLDLLVQGFDSTGILFWSYRGSIPTWNLNRSISIRALPVTPTLDTSGILVGRTEPIQIRGGRLDSLGFLIPDPGAQYITLSCATATATIRYTIDGSTPTWASTMVTAPILINPSYTFRFIAMAPRMFPSPILQVSFRDPNPCNCYVPFYLDHVYPIDRWNGTVITSGPYQIVLRRQSFDPREVIRFTRDGSDPDWASPPLPDTLRVTESFRLKAAIFRGLDRSSAIVDTLLPFGARAN